MLESKTFSSNKKAFSLIELSIVLIIIGLLIAGVTGGASLIKSAELRTAMNEARGYNVAVNNFYTQFDALPGDFGTNIGAVANAADTAVSETGDNNGSIEFINDGESSTSTATNDVVEGVAAWSHLINANIIDDVLTIQLADVSIADSASLAALTCGTELPESKIKDSCWAFDFISSQNVVVLTAGTNAITAGAAAAVTPITAQPTVTNSDALSIDSKLDDGNADTGDVRGVLAACDDVAAGTYDTTDTTKSCTLSFNVDVLS